MCIIKIRFDGKESSICPPIGARDATELSTCCFVHGLSKSRPDVLTVPARLPNAISADDHAGHVPSDRPYIWAGLCARSIQLVSALFVRSASEVTIEKPVARPQQVADLPGGDLGALRIPRSCNSTLVGLRWWRRRDSFAARVQAFDWFGAGWAWFCSYPSDLSVKEASFPSCMSWVRFPSPVPRFQEVLSVI